MRIYRSIFKPLADILSASILLGILSPIIGLVVLVLFFANRGKVFFVQQRIGLNACTFKIIKFKTMRDAFDNTGTPLADELRLTKIGRLLRSASIDEILQLINVLKGEMSVIGPRPLLPKYLPRYSKMQARRHEVKPGITGWAQVNGRNSLSWEEKFRFDVEYVDQLDFWLDFKILWMTVVSIFKRRGISADGHATMEEFKGANKSSLNV